MTMITNLLKSQYSGNPSFSNKLSVMKKTILIITLSIFLLSSLPILILGLPVAVEEDVESRFGFAEGIQDIVTMEPVDLMDLLQHQFL